MVMEWANISNWKFLLEQAVSGHKNPLIDENSNRS